MPVYAMPQGMLEDGDHKSGEELKSSPRCRVRESGPLNKTEKISGGGVPSLATQIRSGTFQSAYQVQSELGRGKFAVVKLCRDMTTGREFAAKIQRKRRKGVDCSKDILAEAAMLELTRHHPCFVGLLDVFESSSDITLITDYACGGELCNYLVREGCVSEGETVRLLRQILDGLGYLHDRSIVHMDIKPQNILLTGTLPGGDIKLCDLGLARYIDSSVSIREIIGTPDYVAPEVLSYEPLQTACDIWSVGVLAYVMLTGCSAFAGDTKQETFLNISQVKLDFPDELFHSISHSAQDFITTLLVREPSERPRARECLQLVWLQVSQPHTVSTELPSSSISSSSPTSSPVSSTTSSTSSLSEASTSPTSSLFSLASSSSINSSAFSTSPAVAATVSAAEEAPAVEQLAPAGEQLAPAEGQLAPAREQLALEEEQLAPVGEQLAPAGEQLAVATVQLTAAVTVAETAEPFCKTDEGKDDAVVTVVESSVSAAVVENIAKTVVSAAEIESTVAEVEITAAAVSTVDMSTDNMSTGKVDNIYTSKVFIIHTDNISNGTGCNPAVGLGDQQWQLKSGGMALDQGVVGDMKVDPGLAGHVEEEVQLFTGYSREDERDYCHGSVVTCLGSAEKPRAGAASSPDEGHKPIKRYKLSLASSLPTQAFEGDVLNSDTECVKENLVPVRVNQDDSMICSLVGGTRERARARISRAQSLRVAPQGSDRRATVISPQSSKSYLLGGPVQHKSSD